MRIRGWHVYRIQKGHSIRWITNDNKTSFIKLVKEESCGWVVSIGIWRPNQIIRKHVTTKNKGIAFAVSYMKRHPRG